MEQQEGSPVAGALIVNLHAMNDDEGFFNHWMKLFHLTSTPLSGEIYETRRSARFQVQVCMLQDYERTSSRRIQMQLRRVDV
jgi:hypothetical protein